MERGDLTVYLFKHDLRTSSDQYLLKNDVLNILALSNFA